MLSTSDEHRLLTSQAWNLEDYVPLAHALEHGPGGIGGVL